MELNLEKPQLERFRRNFLMNKGNDRFFKIKIYIFYFNVIIQETEREK